MRSFKAKRYGVINDMELRHPRTQALYWSLFAILMIIAALCILPPIWILLSSMKNVRELFSVPPTLIPQTWEPEKLVETWEKLNFWTYYRNTFIVLGGTLVVSLFLNSIMGFFLAKLRPRGSGFLFVLMLWTMMLPNSISMVPLYQNLVSFPVLGVNLTNTYIPLWLMAGSNAFFVIVYKGFFDAIPDELIDSGRLDGCTNLQIFSRIILPVSKPVILATSILVMNHAWSDFFWPFLILEEDRLQTVIVKIYNMSGPQGFTVDQTLVATTFAIVPPVLLFLVFQKYIMTGFTLSGIKG